MTREELRDYVDKQRTLNNIPYHVYSALIDGIDTLEQEPCEDAISRSAVFEQINCWIGSGEYRYTNATDYLTKRVANLSSIQPEPKTGHWIYSKAVNTGEIIFSECSVCGHGESRCAKRMNYCPNCGRRMIEPKEREG